MANLSTQADYAKQKGYSRSYISQLKSKGHIVMHGKMVDTAATDALIEENKDFAKQGVADRHARERGEGGEKKQELETLNENANAIYNRARAIKEKHRAFKEEDETKIRRGQLLETERAVNVIANAVTVIRTRLETLPDLLAPRCAAETDEVIIRQVMFEQVEALLEELHRQFKKLAGKHD